MTPLRSNPAAPSAANALDAWERAYRDFETPDQEVRKFERRLRALGADKLARSSRVLEICCGRGNAIQAWERFGFHPVVGLDLSEALLRLHSGGARVVGDIRAMPVARESQDIVAVHGGLHHLPSLDDLDLTLREMHRVLKSDGYALIVEPWSTPFLILVHAVSRQTLARRMSKKVDAFERMYELEHTTYDAWLGNADRILSILTAYLQPITLHRRWGKLMLIARKRHDPQSL
jgi:ubiquinone/menaquinone biosynthesis C-methylase UbiE